MYSGVNPRKNTLCYIETQCENGFPDPEKAEEEMLSITIKNQTTKKIIVWGIGDGHPKARGTTCVAFSCASPPLCASVGCRLRALRLPLAP
jgi:hypothetical protein|tara:strand:+ start:60 stop:332 length:273 start_codon:yes stop_codon:yes gene_type:complete